jgi:hypothetical protein
MEPTTVTAERMARFLGMVATMMAVEVIREVAVWSQWRRRSRTVQFHGAAVKAGWMAWFLGAATAWRQSGWRRRELSGVKEGAGNFGSLTASKSKSCG